MSDKQKPIEIHPQRCYECGTELKVGDPAVASRKFPLAFCTKCRKQSREFAPAVIKAES